MRGQASANRAADHKVTQIFICVENWSLLRKKTHNYFLYTGYYNISERVIVLENWPIYLAPFIVYWPGYGQPGNGQPSADTDTTVTDNIQAHSRDRRDQWTMIRREFVITFIVSILWSQSCRRDPYASVTVVLWTTFRHCRNSGLKGVSFSDPDGHMSVLRSRGCRARDGLSSITNYCQRFIY